MMRYLQTKLLSSKVIIIIIFIILITGFLAWLFIESSKPLPGTKMPDLGREHIEIGKKVEYNSNPPTSGPHYPDWVRAGVYDSERDDRNLVHSLEHGYIIMSYKCSENSENSESQNIRMSESQKSGTSGKSDLSDASGTPSASESSEKCKALKEQLTGIYKKKGERKLVIVPRENLDANFALTAWTYIDKFNPSTSSGLSVSDMERIEKFIDAHRNQGPERTME